MRLHFIQQPGNNLLQQWSKKASDEVKYRGISVTQRGDPKHEIKKRISATMAVHKKMIFCLLKTTCRKKMFFCVYDAVITNKLLHGLESIEPKHAVATLLNTFQLKGLRKILRWHTTYIRHHNTNTYVYKRANEKLNAPTKGPDRRIKPLTEVLELKKLKLLGHVLRRNRQQPQHQVSFATRSALPRENSNRKVGRPRANWTLNTMSKAWNTMRPNDPLLQNQEFNKDDKNIREQIIAQTRQYLPQFRQNNQETHNLSVKKAHCEVLSAKVTQCKRNSVWTDSLGINCAWRSSLCGHPFTLFQTLHTYVWSSTSCQSRNERCNFGCT